jgi:hypothetical protein
MLRRAVQIRWPTEELVIVTDCLADQPRGNPLVGPDDPFDPPQSSGWGPSHAVLAATRARLIYQERTTHATLLRSIAIIIGTIAVAMLFFGTGLMSFAVMALSGLALWVVAKIAEIVTVGSATIEFHHVERMDRMTQRIEGADRSGTAYRLLVPDPSDFGVIASIVDGHGRSAA